MPICYNGRTKKRAVTCSLYGLCIVHSPNFFISICYNISAEPARLNDFVSKLSGCFYAEDERLNKYPRPCG